MRVSHFDGAAQQWGPGSDSSLAPTAQGGVASPVEEEAQLAAGVQSALYEDGLGALGAALTEAALGKGVAEITRETGLEPDSVFEVMSADGSPDFATVQRSGRLLGLKLLVSA